LVRSEVEIWPTFAPEEVEDSRRHEFAPKLHRIYPVLLWKEPPPHLLPADNPLLSLNQPQEQHRAELDQHSLVENASSHRTQLHAWLPAFPRVWNSNRANASNGTHFRPQQIEKNRVQGKKLTTSQSQMRPLQACCRKPASNRHRLSKKQQQAKAPGDRFSLPATTSLP
jgi:hypothetical protein